jgi:hypothetical protein
MKRLLPLLLLALALPGCSIGSDDAAPADDGSNLADRMLACIEGEGIDATVEKEGEELLVGDGPDAPRIRFFLTAGESEARQFQGRGEGAEQIGAALLYVNDGDDETLEVVENCLADQ